MVPSGMVHLTLTVNVKGGTMIEITKANLNDYSVTGEFDIAASVKPEKGSASQKQVTLRFKMDKVPVKDIIQSSLKDKRINWQVGARAKFSSLQAGGVVTVNYTGGKATVDPQTATINFLSSMSEEQRNAWIAENLKPKA